VTLLTENKELKELKELDGNPLIKAIVGASGSCFAARPVCKGVRHAARPDHNRSERSKRAANRKA
jgi:hypothetical protein